MSKSVPYSVLWDKNSDKVHQESLSWGVWSTEYIFLLKMKQG